MAKNVSESREMMSFKELKRFIRELRAPKIPPTSDAGGTLTPGDNPAQDKKEKEKEKRKREPDPELDRELHQANARMAQRKRRRMEKRELKSKAKNTPSPPQAIETPTDAHPDPMVTEDVISSAVAISSGATDISTDASSDQVFMENVTTAAGARGRGGKQKKKRNDDDDEEEEDKEIRSMRLAFLPSSELAEILRRWMDITMEIYDRTVGFLNRYNKAKKPMPTQSLLRALVMMCKDDHMHATETEQVGESFTGLYQDMDADQQRRFNEVPSHIAQEAISEARAAYKAAVSNLKGGHISHFELGLRSESPSWIHKRSLKCNVEAFSVDEGTGKVSFFKNFLKGVKNRIRVRDRLLAWLIPSEPKPKPRHGRWTLRWGRAFEIGKKNGRGARIELDVPGGRWYLRIAYDCHRKGAPFLERVHPEIEARSNKQPYRRAFWWVFQRSGAVYTATGKTCSIDPGARQPLTVFNPNDRWVTVMGHDLLARKAELSKQISAIQSILDRKTRTQNPNPEDGSGMDFDRIVYRRVPATLGDEGSGGRGGRGGRGDANASADATERPVTRVPRHSVVH
jgi:hypothetical protein